MTEFEEKCIFYSLFFEMLGVTSIHLSSDIFAVYTYVLFHLIASFLMSLALAPILAVKFKGKKKKIVLVLTTVIFITFIIGIILSIFYIIFYKHKRKQPEIDIIETDEIEENIPTVKRKLGEGALQNFSKHMPSYTKLNAVSIGKNLKYKNKGRILKEALSDDNDEIRLLAFSILSKDEDSINKSIFELKKKLKDTTSDEEKADLYENIGYLYWESVFLGIVDDELKKYYLKLSKDYFLKALEFKQSAKINFYLGRIALLENNFQLAEKFFTESHRLENKKVIPYLMEIKYIKKDLKAVLNMAEELDLVSIHPNFYFNYKAWAKDET